MGLTFAVTAFACTAPFAGMVLAQGVRTGHWLMPALGIAVYSGTIALPFFAMGIAPSLLKRMPKADSWMHEFKVIGGLVEIGAAIKFLAIADAARDWNLVRRAPALAAWSSLLLVLRSEKAYRVAWRGALPSHGHVREAMASRAHVMPPRRASTDSGRVRLGWREAPVYSAFL